ncbi:MAG: hypothetical protein HDT36_02535 [Clostridiales bacterium]|nr:hypothetical protein [Clostridiales bacterium]
MTFSILSATSYADIAFFVLLALGLVGGIIGGVAKALKGFYKSVAVILFSLLLVGATLTPLCNSKMFRPIKNSFTNMSSDWGVVFTEPIHIAKDGSYYIYVEYDGWPQKMPLESANGRGLVDASKGRLALWLAERFINEDNAGQSLSEAAANMFTSIIVAIISFIVYCILLTLLCFVLRRIFKHLHESDSSVVRTLDRVLGALLAMTLALLFILLVLGILHTMGRIMPTIDEYLKNSVVCGYLYEHNPIGLIFARIFG